MPSSETSRPLTSASALTRRPMTALRMTHTISEVTKTKAMIDTMPRICAPSVAFRHSFHLGGLAVAPEQQGRGVGTRLMRDLLGELRAEGVVRVELGVSADHPRGIAFYEKLSF